MNGPLSASASERRPEHDDLEVILSTRPSAISRPFRAKRAGAPAEGWLGAVTFA